MRPCDLSVRFVLTPVRRDVGSNVHKRGWSSSYHAFFTACFFKRNTVFASASKHLSPARPGDKGQIKSTTPLICNCCYRLDCEQTLTSTAQRQILTRRVFVTVKLRHRVLTNVDIGVGRALAIAGGRKVSRWVMPPQSTHFRTYSPSSATP